MNIAVTPQLLQGEGRSGRKRALQLSASKKGPGVWGSPQLEISENVISLVNFQAKLR